MKIFRISLAVFIYFSTTLVIPQRALSQTDTTPERNSNNLPPKPAVPLSPRCLSFPLNVRRTSRLNVYERLDIAHSYELPDIKQSLTPLVGYSPQDSLFNEIAIQYASIGSSEQALSTVELIRQTFFKAETLIAIAKIHVKGKEQQLAINALSQALDIVESVGNDPQKEVLFFSIAEFYLQLTDFYLEVGEIKLASEAVLLTSQTIEQLKQKLPKKYILSHLALRLPAIGKLDEALTITRNLDLEQNKIDYLLTRIATSSVSLGKVDQALEIVRSFDEDERKDALLQIAIELASIGLVDQAMTIVENSEEDKVIILTRIIPQYINERKVNFAINLVQDIDDYCTRSIAFHELSSQLLEAEEYNLALQITSNIEVANIKNKALHTIAAKLAQIERYDQAMIAIQAIDNSRDKADTLIKIAENLIKVGQPEEAFELLSQALEMVQSSRIPTMIYFPSN